jgi:hypothetical protein
MAGLSTLRSWEQPSQLWTKVERMFTELFAADAAGADALGLITSNAGVPDDAAKASLDVNPVGDENGLTFTAVDYGAAGNDITVAYVDPDADDAELSVSVVGKDISVSLATGAGGAITSTADDVRTAVLASTPAAALVVVAIYAGDTGSEDDGSGVVTALAAANLAGGLDGTGAGTMAPGGLLIDTDNGVPYRNSGTTAVPAWTALADAA